MESIKLFFKFYHYLGKIARIIDVDKIENIFYFLNIKKVVGKGRKIKIKKI